MMFSRQQKGTSLTNILRSAQNLSEFTTCAKPACQAEVHNLDITQWIQTSQENVLGLGKRKQKIM